MKILIDTTQEKLFVLLVNKDFSYVDSYLKSEIKKSDLLNGVVRDLMKKNSISINDINDLYVTTGPGSFMGNRAGLIFVRTIAQVTNINVYAASSFALHSCGTNGEYLIDAKGGVSYRGILENKKDFKIDIVDGNQNITHPKYDEIIDNPSVLLNMFSKINDLSALEPTYIKEPRIGGK